MKKLFLVLLFLFGGTVFIYAAVKKNVNLYLDNKLIVFQTFANNIETALQEQGIIINPLDRIYPPKKSILQKYNKIYITRVEKKYYTVTEKIPFKTIFIAAKNFTGRKRISKYGQWGIKKYTVVEFYKNGIKTKTKYLNVKIIKKPQNQIVVEGLESVLASRGYYLKKAIVMDATAYSADECLGCKGWGKTYLGLEAKKGVVAVDPKYIALGTKLYIPGYGYAIAADIGSAIKGWRIDLCFNNKYEVYNFGRKKITVYILGK